MQSDRSSEELSEMLEVRFEGLVRVPRRAFKEADTAAQAVQDEIGHAGVTVIYAVAEGPA